MPTHETSRVNKDSVPIPPGSPIDPIEAVDQACADMPGGSPSTVLLASINNAIGRGRLRVTTGAGGIPFSLRLTCLVDAMPRTLIWPLQPNRVAVGPNDSSGRALQLTRITKIETISAMGAPVAPGDTVKLDWLRPGARIAAERSGQAVGVYPGDKEHAAPVGQWFPVQDQGPGRAKCSGSWAADDDLVAGAAGTLRKRAVSGDDAAVTIGTATEPADDGTIGGISLG